MRRASGSGEAPPVPFTSAVISRMMMKYGISEQATPSSAVRTLKAYSPYRPFASSASHEAGGALLLRVLIHG